MKGLYLKRIDKTVLIYPRDDFIYSDFKHSEFISQFDDKKKYSEFIIYPNNKINLSNIIKTRFRIHIFTVPRFSKLLDLNLYEILNILYKYNKNEYFVYFHVPKNHPLRREQIKEINKLICKLHNSSAIINTNFKSSIIIDSGNDIKFGIKENNKKIVARYIKGSLNITTYKSNEYDFYHYTQFDFPKTFVKDNINNSFQLIKYFKTTTPSDILKVFKSDDDIIKYIKENYDEVKVNLLSSANDINKLKENIKNTIEESLGIKSKESN